jgi:hypothetical protein
MSMWATVDQFFHNDLAGIQGPGYYRATEIEPGFRHVEISPFIPDDLKWAQDRVRTAYGMVVSRWEKADEGLIVLVQIPAGCRATLKIPVVPSSELTIIEGALVVWRKGESPGPHPGLQLIEANEDCFRISCGCGRFRFIFNTDRSMLKTKIYRS